MHLKHLTAVAFRLIIIIYWISLNYFSENQRQLTEFGYKPLGITFWDKTWYTKYSMGHSKWSRMSVRNGFISILTTSSSGWLIELECDFILFILLIYLFYIYSISSFFPADNESVSWKHPDHTQFSLFFKIKLSKIIAMLLRWNWRLNWRVKQQCGVWQKIGNMLQESGAHHSL